MEAFSGECSIGEDISPIVQVTNSDNTVVVKKQNFSIAQSAQNRLEAHSKRMEKVS